MQFTEKFIQSLKSKAIRYDIREKSGDGFGVRVSTTGVKTWIFFYTFEGRKRRMSLGTYPSISLAEARIKHRKALAILDNDKDPGSEKLKNALESRSSPTVENLIEEYLNEYAKPNKRSWEEDKRILYKDALPSWGRYKAKDITRRDVIQLLDKIKERGKAHGKEHGSPVIANRTLACVRRMYNFAIKRALLDSSPCVMIEAPAKENRRDRYLSTEEIKKFWHGLDKAPMSNTIKLAFKFLLVTAQRKSEVITAEWSEIDFSTNIWTIPADKAKNGLAHRVPLSKLALELLAQIRKGSADSRWLFPSDRTNAPIRGQSVDHALRRCSPVFSGIDSFHVHDCRRTAATHMTSIGISRLVVSKILNHAESSVTAIYDRHSYDLEKLNALEAWSKKLKEIVFGEFSKNIIALRA